MNDIILPQLLDKLTELKVSDITQSILTINPELSLGTGLMRSLSYLPSKNLQSVLEFTNTLNRQYTVSEYFALLKGQELLDFSPYLLNDSVFGTTIVCAINRFIIYKDGYFKVLTDLNDECVLSCSVQSVACVLTFMHDNISVDCYNAILATMLCTAYMCDNIREAVRVGASCVTDFMRYVTKDCKANQVYSVETFKSKLSWISLIQKHNHNYAVMCKNRLMYNISIGADAVTIEYMTVLNTIGHVTFLFEQNHLGTYDSLFKVKGVYFAYALYLIVSDIFTTDFDTKPETGIDYTVVESVEDLYRR